MPSNYELSVKSFRSSPGSNGFFTSSCSPFSWSSTVDRPGIPSHFSYSTFLEHSTSTSVTLAALTLQIFHTLSPYHWCPLISTICRLVAYSRHTVMAFISDILTLRFGTRELEDGNDDSLSGLQNRW